MKLDVNVLRYLSKEDFRVLTAVEMGQKNHEIVPSSLIDSIAGLKHGGTFKCLKHLLRHKLVHHDNSKYDGYRLTYLGYDYLAIKALVNRGAIAGVGRQIGVGKESDIFEVTNEEGEVMALKLHRLGRTSFRAVKSKRDYLRKGSHFSWLYLSRLAALKEYAFMKALGDHGLPVPKAIDHNRHAVLMTLLDAYPLVQVRQLSNPRRLYVQLMEMLARLAGLGLVHCDYNEFNLLVNEEEEITLIDFPQMVSVSHPNAQELFERDVECIIRFFSKKLGYVPEQDEELELIRPSFQEAVAAIQGSIDTELRASGFKREHQDALDRFITSKHEDSDEEDDGSSSGEESDDEGEEGSSSSASGSSLQALVHFRRWLRPRLPAVEELQLFMTVSVAEAAPVALLGQLLAGSGAGLLHYPPLPLTRLVLLWPGAVDFDPGALVQLPALRSLTFFDTRLRVTGTLPGPTEQGGQPVVLPPLTDFEMDGGQLLDAAKPWLPPTVTALKLCDCGLRALPQPLLNSLPHLRSLKVHHNELMFRSLAPPLSCCTALELLNLSCCGLRSFPSELSGLTRLKVLYLHGAFRRTLEPGAAVAEAAWDALRPLTALRFLAISSNSLPALPPAVAQMAHLHALHCEQNRFSALPLGPYLCSLRELLLGWHTALGSTAALRAATRLSRLVLWRTSLQEAPADPEIDLPAEAGESFVEALAAMPALRRVDDDMKRPGSYLLHPAVAQAMLRMGQRCPHLQLGVLQGKSIGWGVARLREAEREEEREAQQAQQAGQQQPNAAA